MHNPGLMLFFGVLIRICEGIKLQPQISVQINFMVPKKNYKEKRLRTKNTPPMIKPTNKIQSILEKF